MAKKFVTIKLPFELVKDLNYKLRYKQNDIWVKLREAIKENSDYCLCCGAKIRKGGDKR